MCTSFLFCQQYIGILCCSQGKNGDKQIFEIRLDKTYVLVYYNLEKQMFYQVSEMERTILHVDCNKFYASVECLHRPEIRHLPVAVGGSEESRHGIILTKNELASQYGLVVGEPLWQARRKCPDLVVVPPNYALYVRFSKMARKIYEDYTDAIEPFGLDENWLDVTGDVRTGEQIAQEIRRRVKTELGITVSVGVSFNKIFAKLGSDYKKPDAVTVISRSNFKELVWPLPCRDLLYVGPATEKKLKAYGIFTIGELAQAELSLLRSLFGKNGDTLHAFANGLDASPVQRMDANRAVKSVGNSTTTPRDLTDNQDVKVVFTVLAESVARRMREQGLKGTTVCIHVRDKNLHTFTRQKKLKAPTDVSGEILKEAMALFLWNYNWSAPLRSLGIAVTDFDFDACIQLDLDKTQEKREKQERLEQTVDVLKKRFGNYCIQRASLLGDTGLSRFNPHDDHTIHPIGFF